jgi:hypothetical protein
MRARRAKRAFFLKSATKIPARGARLLLYIRKIPARGARLFFAKIRKKRSRRAERAFFVKIRNMIPARGARLFSKKPATKSRRAERALL